MKFSTFTVKTLAAALLLTSTTGLALAGANFKGERDFKGEAPCPPPAALMDGFYVGVQGGYDSYRVREDVAVPALGFSGHTTENPTGGVGGLFLGYGRYLNDMFYLGGEVFGNYSGAESTESSSFPGLAVNSKFTARGAWGVSALPGFRINPTLLTYVRLGYNWSSLKEQDTVNGISFNKSSSRGGFNYGLGMESLIMDNWSLRGEYTHTDYNNLNTSVTTYKASDNQFMAAIVYHIMY